VKDHLRHGQLSWLCAQWHGFTSSQLKFTWFVKNKK